MSSAKTKWYLEKFGDLFHPGADFHDVGKERLTQEQEVFIKSEVSGMAPRDNQELSLSFAAQMLLERHREASQEKTQLAKTGLLSTPHGPAFFGVKHAPSAPLKSIEQNQPVEMIGLEPKPK